MICGTNVLYPANHTKVFLPDGFTLILNHYYSKNTIAKWVHLHNSG